MLFDKTEKHCQIIEVAIPEDSGVKEKEVNKVEKYQNLARELRWRPFTTQQLKIVAMDDF